MAMPMGGKLGGPSPVHLCAGEDVDGGDRCRARASPEPARARWRDEEGGAGDDRGPGCVLPTAAGASDGLAKRVEGMAGDFLEGMVLLRCTLLAPGLAGAALTGLATALEFLE